MKETNPVDLEKYNCTEIRVYVAGPYSSNPEANTDNAIFHGDWLAALGFFPYVPHLTHFWEQRHHHEYEFWLKQDMVWLRLCHAVLRLPGHSSGADGEVKEAESLGIPVFNDILTLNEHFKS